MKHNFSIKKSRKIDVSIQGVPVEGGDVTEAFASFQSISLETSLVIAEIPCVSKEVERISRDLLSIGGVITAIHNHWIFDKPRMYYIHWEMKGDTLEILDGLDEIWSYL